MADPNERDVLEQAEQWSRDGHGVAIVTVVRTWPSSPRPVGSQLVVRDDGHFLGSISGGCAEGMVVAEAQKTLADGQTRSFEFGVTGEQARQFGLACGGRGMVYIEAVT
ncbi:MAG: XdhC family protein [Myxococcales bacterium]|nr:XdhC family protein [Myxococcales bacterium]